MNKIFVLLLTFSTFFLSAQTIERRAALDIGSGKIKIQVSDVDLTDNRIVNVLFTDTANVGLREDLSKSLDGRLSSEIQNQTIHAIAQLITQASQFQPNAYHAVGTESLRLAKNADVLVERIQQETGVNVTIVTQEEEGILGFISAISEADVDPDRAISWDFGGGSFQITTKCADRYLIYQGKLGKVPLKNALLKIQGKNTFSPNPVSQSQTLETIQFIKHTLQDIPFELRQKLQESNGIVLGIGINPLWGLSKCNNFDRRRILNELNERLDLDDFALRNKYPMYANPKEAVTYIVSNLILADGVMEAFDISQVRYVGTQGANAVGLLLSSQYWNNFTHPISDE